MKTENYIVAFHIGRGGRFHNPGHKSYNNNVKNFQHLLQLEYDHLYLHNVDEVGNILPDEEWTMTDANGNVLLEGRDEIESETGILDYDGDYDTDIVKYVEDCDDGELALLYDAYLDGEYMDEEVKDFVCEQQNMNRIHKIDFYQTNAEVHCQDCTLTFFWDGEEDVTEEDAAEWMRENDIDPLSIKNHADSFESHFYNN
jgi:hypothetical protein